MEHGIAGSSVPEIKMLEGGHSGKRMKNHIDDAKGGGLQLVREQGGDGCPVAVGCCICWDAD